MAADKDADKEKDKNAAKGEAPAAKEGEGEAAEMPAGRFAFLTKFLTRKMLMFVVAPAAAVLILGVVAYFFLFSGGEEAAVAEGGHGEAAGAHGEAAAEHADVPHPVFLDIEDIMVNVASGTDKPAFLKLAVSLELEGEGEEAKAAVEPVVPRIRDQMQTYLRELRVEDLSGSAAMFRLKEELLRRVNLAVEPVKVKDVLFREMIVQ